MSFVTNGDPVDIMLADFLDGNDAVVKVEITTVHGSSPREAGTTMYVSPRATYGTIGGGQLEWRAIEAARLLLTSDRNQARMEVALGPEIGQCCGGRVELEFLRMDAAARRAILAADASEFALRPHVHIFGAGHVGRALARFFLHLPVKTFVLDSRQEELQQSPSAAKLILTSLPESKLRQAPPGSAFIIATHDHALDFLLAAEALVRRDAAYVGLIGSATKRARFLRFAKDTHPDLPTHELVCPIGANGRADKRPAVIAAFVVAEVMAALVHRCATAAEDGKTSSGRRQPRRTAARIHKDIDLKP